MSLKHFQLEGKVALITGASSGIGNTVAKGLAKAGATVVVAARREDRLKELVSDIKSTGGKAVRVAMDVGDRASVDAAFERAESLVGTVNIIVNNAGIADPKNFMKTDAASRDQVMNTNFNGVWNVAQEGARRMIDRGETGSIINIASVLGFGVQPGQAAYCSSKGAVIQLTRSLSLDLMRYGIRVNAIAPGWFKTEINQDYFNSPSGQAYVQQMPARRLGKVEELIGPIIMLASEAGSFVNGAVIPVDGAISVVAV